MNGKKQSKQPTKKESAKIRKHEVFKILDKLEGDILEITDMFDDDSIPLNLLKLELDKIRLDGDLEIPTEWIVSWNKMIDAFYASSEKYCFTNRDSQGLPINLPVEVLGIYIKTIKDNY